MDGSRKLVNEYTGLFAIADEMCRSKNMGRRIVCSTDFFVSDIVLKLHNNGCSLFLMLQSQIRRHHRHQLLDSMMSY